MVFSLIANAVSTKPSLYVEALLCHYSNWRYGYNEDIVLIRYDFILMLGLLFKQVTGLFQY